MLEIAPVSARINDIREGRALFDETLAAYVLEKMNFPYQRRIERPHVETLAAQMRAGIWLSGKQIAFGRFGNNLFLVDGQHRLSAVVLSGLPQEFQVLVIPCQTERELRELFYGVEVRAGARKVRRRSRLENAASIERRPRRWSEIGPSCSVTSRAAAWTTTRPMRLRSSIMRR